jgi:flagellar biosynthesis/type III secretory pathway chaperone
VRIHRGTVPVKHGLWPTIATGSAVLLGGCFFDQVQRSEESDIQRVEQKQAVLQAEQERSTRLGQQEEQLTAEMSERQLSLTDLSARVQEINTENGRAIADNEAARAHYLALLAELHDTNEELALAQHGAAGSIAERRERIASLTARLKAQLDLLLR